MNKGSERAQVTTIEDGGYFLLRCTTQADYELNSNLESHTNTLITLKPICRNLYLMTYYSLEHVAEAKCLLKVNSSEEHYVLFGFH